MGSISTTAYTNVYSFVQCINFHTFLQVMMLASLYKFYVLDHFQD